SLLLIPDKTSVGTSGAIMGLLGFLIIMGLRRRHIMPLVFLRNMVISVVLIAALGLVAYELIDNAAHLGGLLTGLAMGMILVDTSNTMPLNTSALTRAAGMASGLAIITTAVFACGVMIRGASYLQ